MTRGYRRFGGNSTHIYPTTRRCVSEHWVLQRHHSQDQKCRGFLQHNEKWKIPGFPEKDSCVISNASFSFYCPIKMRKAINWVCCSRGTNTKTVQYVICCKTCLMCQWDNLNLLDLLYSGHLHSKEQMIETSSSSKCLIKYNRKCNMERSTFKRQPRDLLE